ncbi:Ras-related protein RABD2a [Glycine soja]|uniref:Ras-related protein RABD2a n=1 Tax=Glycine soja TaxID=3848 RepID=A0A0B2R8H2_GLYSO|nr:Ras-related protein RABD2a [Glycine soja]
MALTRAMLMLAMFLALVAIISAGQASSPAPAHTGSRSTPPPTASPVSSPPESAQSPGPGPSATSPSSISPSPLPPSIAEPPAPSTPSNAFLHGTTTTLALTLPLFAGKTSSASRCFFHSTRQETLTRPSETVPRRVECGNQWTQSPIIPCCQCPYWSKALPVTLQSNPPKTSHSKELFGSIHQWPFDFTNESVMASQPVNNARPPTVQIRGQPVNQKAGCCST